MDYLSPESWHRHKNVFIDETGSPDVVFEQDLSPAPLYERFTVALNSDDDTLFLYETLDPALADAVLLPGCWMMHAWVHEQNSRGLFAGINPLVSPDAIDQHGGHGSNGEFPMALG